MTLDTPTLYTSVMVADFSGALFLLILYVSIKHKPGTISLTFLLWAAALFTAGLGTVLIALRGSIPDWISIIVANSILMLCAGLRPNAVATFFGRKSYHWFGPAAALVWVVLCFVPSFRDSVAARVIFVNGILMLTGLYAAWISLRHNQENLLTAKILAGTMTLEAGGFSIFIVHHIDRQYTDFLQAFNTSATSAGLIIILISMVVSTMTIAAMALERLQNQFRTQAHEDVLTGLPNRRAFFDAAKAMVIKRNAPLKTYSLALIDLDHFKTVNDTYGHAMGDAVLRLLGRICSDMLPEKGVVGRVGGEEFALFLPDTGMETIGVLITRIGRQLTLDSSAASQGKVKMTLSAGVFTGAKDKQIDHALEIADRCLYDAKAGGRNRIVGYDETASGQPARAVLRNEFARTQTS